MLKTIALLFFKTTASFLIIYFSNNVKVFPVTFGQFNACFLTKVYKKNLLNRKKQYYLCDQHIEESLFNSWLNVELGEGHAHSFN